MAYTRITPVFSFFATTLIRLRSLEKAITRSRRHASGCPPPTRISTFSSCFCSSTLPLSRAPRSNATSSGLSEKSTPRSSTQELHSSTQRSNSTSSIFYASIYEVTTTLTGVRSDHWTCGS